MNQLAESILNAWAECSPPTREVLEYVLQEDNLEGDCYVSAVPLLDGKAIDQVPWEELGFARCNFILQFAGSNDGVVFYMGAISYYLATTDNSSAIIERVANNLETCLEDAGISGSLSPEKVRCIRLAIDKWNMIWAEMLEMNRQRMQQLTGKQPEG